LSDGLLELNILLQIIFVFGFFISPKYTLDFIRETFLSVTLKGSTMTSGSHTLLVL